MCNIHESEIPKERRKFKHEPESSDQYRKIRAAMMLHGVTNKQIAEQENVTESYVTFVITGRRVGHRIRAAIATACGVPVSELWPDEDDLPQAA